MPITNGVGHSRFTPDKQEGLASILEQQLNTVHKMRQTMKWIPKKFIFIDCYAGRGTDPHDGSPGSPLVFEEAAKKIGEDYESYAIEKEKDNCDSLRSLVGSKTSVVNGDCSEVVPPIVQNIVRDSKYHYGVIYADPNGVPDLSPLKYAAERLEKVDILLRLSAANMKRAGKNIAEMCQISTGSNMKSNWLIREPVVGAGDKHQWIFMFGTNFKAQKEWASRRWYSIHTPKGAAIFNRVCSTSKQLQESLQTSIFDHPLELSKSRSGGVCEECHSAPISEPHHLRYTRNETANDIVWV